MLVKSPLKLIAFSRELFKADYASSVEMAAACHFHAVVVYIKYSILIYRIEKWYLKFTVKK